MGVLEAINQVLDGLCGEDLQRRMAALWEICQGTMAGEVITQKILRLIREDVWAKGFVLLECEREYNQLRAVVKQWEVTIDGAVMGQYASFVDAQVDYQQLQRSMAGKKLSLHRIEAAPQVLMLPEVG